MKKIISIFTVISLLLIGFQMFLVVGENEQEIEMPIETRGGQRGSILYVGPGQTYTTIGAAVTAGNTGDTIRVYAGTYNENVVIDKGINLIGNGTANTIIDGKGSGDVVKITANWVNITGFTLTNGGDSFGDSGVELEGVQHCKVYNNKVYLNKRNGIFLSSSSSNNNVIDNNVSLNGENGIWVSSSSKNIIKGNNVSNNDRSGIEFTNSISNKAAANNFTKNGIGISGTSQQHFNSHNISLDNLVNGKPIYFYKNKSNINLKGKQVGQVIIANCTNINLNNLHINNTDIGVSIAYSSHITLTNSNITNNIGSILIDYSSYLTITGNTLINNEFRGRYGSNGFWIRYSNNSTISFNNFLEIQGNGITLIKSSNFDVTNNHMVGELSIFDIGISIAHNSNNNHIVNNNVSKWPFGIYIDTSSSNYAIKNDVSNNTRGIHFWAASYNFVTKNNVLINQNGITLYGSSNNNNIYHNNIINNNNQAYDDASNNGNQWDNNYPSGGNYWSDYKGKDDGSGTGNHSISGDGIGDTQIPHLGLDNYPFTSPIFFSNLKPIANAGQDQNVYVNQTVYFDGSESYDPDNDTLAYNWAFGDGTSTNWYNNCNSSHVYNKSGEYTVTLFVNDGVGGWESVNDTCKVKVSKGSPLANSPWPKFRGNLKNTGLSPYDTSENTGKLKWEFSTGYSIQSSPTIDSNGTIYVGSNDYKLYAINPDGTEKWRYITDYYIFSSPAIDLNGTIYVGSNDHKLYAINSDGTLKWSFLTEDWIRSSPTIGLDGTIYVGSDDDKLYAINPDGTLKWDFKTQGDVRSSPALGSDGTIYIGSDDSKLYAINPDGTNKWSYNPNSPVRSSPAIGSDGTIYMGTISGKFYAINPDGTEKWIFSVGTWIESSPAIGSNGVVYVGSNDNKLYAVNPDGTKKWSFTTYDAVRTSPIIGSEGTIYFGSNDKNFYAVYPNGTKKWNFNTDLVMSSSAAIGSDGTIYFGSNENKLYAIGTPTNQPPIANITIDPQSYNKNGTLVINGPIYFNGSGSYDPDEDDLTYQWDFADGSSTDWQNSAIITHSYSKSGDYLVTLTVSDGSLMDSDTCTINVSEVVKPHPIIDENFLTVIELDEDFGKFSQQLTDFESHWDSEIVGDNLKWYVTGNSNTIFHVIGDNSTGENSDTIIFNSIVNQHGNEVITYHLRDPFGSEAVINQTVIVHPVNDPPIASAGPNQNITLDQSINLDGNGSYDPEGDLLVYEWTSNIDGKLGSSIILKNIKLSEGIHTITLTVSDGELISIDTCIVRVSNISVNLPPVAKIKPIVFALEGEIIYLSATDSFDRDGYITTYIWNFGDNSEEVITNTSEVEHTWSSAGNYTITLTVIDDHGMKDSVSLEIIVAQFESIDSDNDDKKSQDNTLAYILIVIVIIILLLIASWKIFLSRSKRQREQRPNSDEEILSKMKHKFLQDEPLSEMEYSRNEISEILERKFKTGQLSEDTYHFIKSEVLFSEEVQSDQMINLKPEGKE